MDIGIPEATRFLTSDLGLSGVGVERIGAGVWSQCFGFASPDGERVIRFGEHVEDFAKDRHAHAFAAPALPIPEVLEIGEAFEGFFAISTRARGTPLEYGTPDEWEDLVLPLVDALEAMRTAPISSGWGGWDASGAAHRSSWSHTLLTVDSDPPGHRTHGWSEKLRGSPMGAGLFERGYHLLREAIIDEVPRCLTHNDLLNRNVHVDGGTITGVFDWGCSMYGDHLYELAWFEFWDPWHPDMDTDGLLSAVDERWKSIGFLPDGREQRRMVCLLHIGLDHLAYNAHLTDWGEVAAVERRMRELIRDL